jgi:hypothetical protein
VIFRLIQLLGKRRDSWAGLQIEPHSNGPLFVELHALLRIRREDEVLANWQGHNPTKPPGSHHTIAVTKQEGLSF